MANRIKGITIEIDGNTTKLDKALDGTNKQIKTTQTNLKDVERLLKMDPGNTELLAQKQRLLSEAVGATSDKLKTLQNAAKDADTALARGQAYEARYAPLKAEIDSVTQEIQSLMGKQEEMEQGLSSGTISTQVYDDYMGDVENAQQRLDELKKAKQDLDTELQGTKMNQAQYDALQRELIETQDAAKKAEKAFGEFNATAEEFSATANKVADGAGKIADATKGISSIAASGAKNLLEMAVNAGLYADDLNTLSKQSGFSTEDLQQWTYAADLIDVSVESIISAATRMKKNMVSTSADTQAAFMQLGVSVYGNSGQLRDSTEVFYELLTALSKVPNETERDVLAMQIFGRGADELAGIIDDGGQALRAYGQEAKDAGLILSQDALDGANAFNDGLDRVKATANAAFMEAGSSLAENLLPVMENAVAALGSLLQWLGSLDGGTLQMLLNVLIAVAGISPVAGLVSDVAGGLAGILILTGQLSGSFNLLGGAAGAASTAVGAVTTSGVGMGAAFGGALEAVGSVFMGPVGIVALAALAVIALTALWETNEDFRNSMMEFDQWITGVFSTDWTETFGAAGETLNGLSKGWLDFYEAVKRILGGIIDLIAGTFTGDWERAWQGVQDIFGGIMDGLVALAKAPFNGVIGAVNTLLQYLSDGLNAAIELLNGISFDIPDWVPAIGGNTFGLDIPTVTAPQIPYLASGGVLTRPTMVMAGEYANAQQDPEIVSPYSKMVQANKEALRESGMSGRSHVTLEVKAAPGFTRYLSFELASESARQGVDLVTT